MTIKGITFISRVVRDLDTSLAFYRDYFDLKVVMGPGEYSGPEMDSMTGIDSVKFRIVMLQGNEGAIFELMQFLNPIGKQFQEINATDVGHTFMAIEVSNLDQVLEDLKLKGLKIENPIQEYQGGKFCYIWGPDQELIELMELDSPLSYPC
jgi:catechol 2,3-dioxygenase-like lactoylglutathione lyase family enzyme